jgi:hypothetical protein
MQVRRATRPQSVLFERQIVAVGELNALTSGMAGLIESVPLELDGSVPADHPIIDDVQSHLYSHGHRNAQGIAFGPSRLLHSGEQGPTTDDERNLIKARKMTTALGSRNIEINDRQIVDAF